MYYTIFFAVLAVVLAIVAIVAYQLTGVEGIAAGILVGAAVSLVRSVAPGLFMD